jgi:hypothetical protein
VSDVLIAYRALRAEGAAHRAAIEEIAAVLGVDPSTAHRVIRRAQDAEGRGAPPARLRDRRWGGSGR